MTCIGANRQTALLVVESQPLVPQLFPKRAVLFLEVVIDVLLLLVEPSGQDDENEPERFQILLHGAQVTTPASQLSFARIGHNSQQKNTFGDCPESS